MMDGQAAQQSVELVSSHRGVGVGVAQEEAMPVEVSRMVPTET